jgi:carbon storage regulator
MPELAWINVAVIVLGGIAIVLLAPPKRTEEPMLVLTRKPGERFVIGNGPDAVFVTVIEIDHGKVRLGIEAPKHLEVDREEIRQRKDAQRGAE